MSTSDEFAQIAAKFKSRLTDQEKHDFQICTLQDVRDEIERIQKRQEAKREMRNLRRIESFLEAAQQFGQVIETFTNTNNMVAFIWGPMKLILQVASSWVYAFDRILEGYEKLGESFPMLEQYIDLFGEQPELEKVLRLLYEDILDFHRKTLRFFTRPAWRQVFRALWMDFNATFQYLLNNLDRHSRLLHDQAQTIHMLDARQSFHEIKSAMANLQQEQTDAKLKVEQDERRRRDDEKQSVLTWIAGSVAIAKDHHDAALMSRSDDPNSGSWILQNRILEDWLNEEFPKASLVWMSGVPGAGKTVLASVVIDHCINNLNEHTAFFYCRHDDPDTLTSAGIFKALVMQQLCWRSDLVPYLVEQKRDSSEPVLSSDRLAASLFVTLCKGSEKQYVIVDGIDECLPDQRVKVLNCLNAVVNECDANQPGKLRVLVVSQNEKDIRRALGNATELCISEPQNVRSHQEDINSYVEKRAHEIESRYALDEAACQMSNMTMANINDHMRLIALEAAGQFLYAKLVMENLLEQGSQGDFFEEIGSRRLPKGLAEAYERIIVRLRRKENRWDNARLLFGWMTCAVRPLKWHEIQGMKSIDRETDEVNMPRHSFRDDAVEICGSLIAIHGDRVMFMHSTARKFIAASTHVDLPVVECELIALCLRYLSLPCFDLCHESEANLVSDQQDHDCHVQNGSFAFADYAVSAWMQHLINVCNAAPRLLETSRWDGPEGREIVVQEVEEAAEGFVERYLQDDPDPDHRSPAVVPENSCVEAAKQLFCDVVDSGRHVQLLVKHVTKLQSTAEGYKKIGLPLLEKNFERMRRTVEFLAGDRSGPAETVSQLRSFYGDGGSAPETMSRLRGFYGDKLFKCSRPRCTFFHEGFTDAGVRRHHVRRHERPYQCDVLGCTSIDFAFANKADLKRHVEEFHPDTEIKARLFATPEVVPKGKAKWLCGTCGRSFTRRGILKDHELVHAGIRPHECRFCGKTFTRKNDLVRHEKGHENRIRR